MYAFFGKSAEPDPGEKYGSLPEESVTVTGSEVQGSGFVKISRSKATLNGELGTCERIQFTMESALPDRRLFQESSFPHNQPAPDSFLPAPADFPK
jgi:hypothetical protein